MRLIRTIKIQLPVAPNIVLPTIRAYTNAFNYICETGWQDLDCSKFSLQKKVYAHLRLTLPAQLCITCIAKAAEALKAATTKMKQGESVSCPTSKQCSIRYDIRSYTLKLNELYVSLLFLDGRHKFKFQVPKFFHKYLGWKQSSADVFVRDNQVFLHVVMQTEIQEIPTSGVTVGIDRGIKNIAVLSNNTFFDGKHLNKVRTRYATLRSKLQEKCTRSARRHLNALGRKEKRFVAAVMHTVSKKIVSLFSAGTTFVLEKLSGIRSRCKMRKPQRTQLHKWPFYQFQMFLTYKAIGAGMSVEYIDPAYTSQTCSKCGYCCKANRRSQSSFLCKECGFELHADLNASRNIRNKSVGYMSTGRAEPVTQPIVQATK